MLKVTWLGQAGLLFQNEEITIIVDPYLSDSVVKVNPNNYRRVPIDESFFKIRPDVFICTHDHLDHYDPETAPIYLERDDNKITVLSSEAAFYKLLKHGHGQNYVLMKPHTEWMQNGIKFTAVKAFHSETTAIGIIIDDGDKKYYITGDTLYNSEIFSDIPCDIDALFLPINGIGNNMNMTDAKRFAEKVNAKKVVPLHFGMFDCINPNEFDCNNKVIPALYKQIEI